MAIENRLFTQDVSVIQVFSDKPNYTDLTTADLLRDFLGEFENISINSQVSSNPGRAIGEISKYPIPYEVGWEISVSGRVDGANTPLMYYSIPQLAAVPPIFGGLRSLWLWIWLAPNITATFGKYSYIVRCLMTHCTLSGSGEDQTQTATFETQGDLFIYNP